MKKNLMLFVSFVLTFFAAVIGGDVMAVAVGENGSDDDPNEGNPLSQATKDEPDMGMAQEGHAATGSAVEQAELDDAQISEYIMKYEAWKYPMHTDFLNAAKKAYVKTKKPKHPVLGEAILECRTKGETTNASKEHTVTLNLFGNDAKLFQEKSTILVKGVKGYDGKGDAEANKTAAALVLYVESNIKGTAVVVSAINGPKETEDGETYVPTIPINTVLRAMAPALAESELRVASDNILPGWRQAYLQKKACAITKTDFYERMKKLVNFGGQMVKDAVLSNFRKKCTSTLFFGAPGVISKYVDTTGTNENCYFQEGVLTQLQGSYQLNGLPAIADLIAISRMMFTKYAKTNVAQAYCGSLFIEWLANMDFTKHPEIQFTAKRDALGVKVGTFESNFGTLEFKLDYAMDENGMAGNAIIFPMSEAIRYIYEEKTVGHDHKNDTDAHDAKSEYYIVDDCLMLTGMCSLFVGQDVSVAGLADNKYTRKIVSVASLTGVTTKSTDVIYYLTQVEGTYSIGTYVWTGTEWKVWTGSAVA